MFIYEYHNLLCCLDLHKLKKVPFSLYKYLDLTNYNRKEFHVSQLFRKQQLTITKYYVIKSIFLNLENFSKNIQAIIKFLKPFPII